MSYDILEHTADEKFKAVGDSLEDVFSETVKAFAEVVGADPEAGNTRHKIHVTSENHEALLFDFLDELIYLQDTEGVAVTHVKEISIEENGDGNYRLEAELWTDTITDSMSLQDIKGPTYNEMKIDYEKGEGYVIEAVLDI